MHDRDTLMNSLELIVKLKDSSVRDDEVSIGPPFRDNTLCLKKEDDGWHVYFFERGRRSFEEVFSGESEACHRALERATAHL
jgi:hypothetical protein